MKKTENSGRRMEGFFIAGGEGWRGCNRGQILGFLE